jgi:archaemetzincin
MKRLLSLLVIFSLSSCDRHETILREDSPANFSKQSVVIDLQPFDDVPKDYINYVQDHLSKVYKRVVVKGAIPLPSTSYYEKRNRYRADSLINFLRIITPKDHVTLGLTTRDISHTKGKNY